MGLEQLPDSCRIWIFIADRKFTSNESSALQSELSDFVSTWKAHGNALSAGFDLVYDCVVVLAVDESAELPSGCSIDKAFRLLQVFGSNNGLDFFQRTSIVKVADGQGHIMGKAQALDAVKNGNLHGDDPVLNTLIADLGTFRGGALIPFSESWLGKMQKTV